MYNKNVRQAAPAYTRSVHEHRAVSTANQVACVQYHVAAAREQTRELCDSSIDTSTHRPPSFLIAPARQRVRRQCRCVILSLCTLLFDPVSLCRASNLLRRIFSINKSYLNKRILFNSFTYLSVCACVFHHSPLHSHITRAARRSLPHFFWGAGNLSIDLWCD